MKYGGIKGLFHWNVRKKQDSKLPRVQREQQKGNAKTDLESSLKKNFSADVAGAKEEYQSKLQASLENALWYGVDVEKLVKNVFSEAPRTRRGFMQEACRGVKSLAVIVGYLADGNATYQGLESQLRIGLFRFLECSRAGGGLTSPDQIEVWPAIEQAFKVAEHFGFGNELIESALTGHGLHELLFLARHHYLGCSGSFSVLRKVCENAFMRLEKTPINAERLTSLNDAELEAFGELAKCYNFHRFKELYKPEKEKREVIKAKDELFESFSKRLLLLCATTAAVPAIYPFSAEVSKKITIPKADSKAMLRKAISASDAKTVVAVAKLANANSEDGLIVEAAKEYLVSPDLAEIDDRHLIDYLRLAENELLPEVRALFVEEAANRALAISKAATTLLSEQFNPDLELPFTCRRFVRAALEFGSLEKLAADLQEAAGVERSSEAVKKNVGDKETGKYSRKYKLSILQSLAKKLRTGFKNQEGRAEEIESFITRINTRKGPEVPVRPSRRDDEEINEALSAFVFESGTFKCSLPLERLDADQEKKFRAMFLKHVAPTTNSRKVADGSKEFPVCAQFLRDMTETSLSVGNALIPKFVGGSGRTQCLSRGRAFLKEMQMLENITDAQILMASRIANQSIKSVFSDFIYCEHLFSPSAGVEAGVAATVSSTVHGLVPSDLHFDEKIFMKNDGNLAVHVYASQKNVREWKDISGNTNIYSDENASSFLAKLDFEVDRNGEIRDNLSIKTWFERKVVPFPSS